MIVANAFPLLGESPAIDLVNTRVLRRGTLVDLLARRGALAGWLRAEARQLEWSGALTAADLEAVRGVRDTIDALLRAHLARRPAPVASLAAFNRILAMPPAGSRLEWRRGGPRRVAGDAGTARDRLLRALALDALDLLTGPAALLLRECAHPGCRLLFVARNRRRRWCSSATCGNRARVSRHYARDAGRASA